MISCSVVIKWIGNWANPVFPLLSPGRAQLNPQIPPSGSMQWDDVIGDLKSDRLVKTSQTCLLVCSCFSTAVRSRLVLLKYLSMSRWEFTDNTILLSSSLIPRPQAIIRRGILLATSFVCSLKGSRRLSQVLLCILDHNSIVQFISPRSGSRYGLMM
jgi:hypothetical protein